MTPKEKAGYLLGEIGKTLRMENVLALDHENKCNFTVDERFGFILCLDEKIEQLLINLPLGLMPPGEPGRDLAIEMLMGNYAWGLTAGANGLDKGAGQAKAKSFCQAGMAALGRQKNTLRMETLIGHIALAADLMPQIETEKFLKNNPDIPSGAKNIIQDIFANIPKTRGSSLQQEALDLVKKHTAKPNGLPVDARVVIDRTDPEHPKPLLSFDSTVQVDFNAFATEFGETTTVSSASFGETVLANQFVADLARAPITVKGGNQDVYSGQKNATRNMNID